ncbi:MULTISPECIES: hypothetical protein [Pseudomonas]|uniref:hypothetical protein n=1 Tax=Pseudomonas TaxID=286 RepID=UPI000F034079|nr:MULTISPECIES: hypothetical protein [Pseudomonas]MBK3446008.1 hypothetical protein [Pseudomonas lactis]MCF5022813.1 hypothetical protein [Pseudomonas lurida]MCF5310779.1 hypothetical protein [Pseudomonas lurida]
MLGASKDTHPAKRVSVHLLALIAQAPTAVEAWLHDIRAQELILNLQGTETISKLDGDNLRILCRVALEKRLHKIANA